MSAPSRSHETFRYHWRGSTRASASVTLGPAGAPTGSARGGSASPAPGRAHGERREHRDQSAGAGEQRVGRPPAELCNEPRRQRPGGDVGQVEADQHESERETTPLAEPACDSRGGEQVEARHADTAQHPDEEVELPESRHRGGERERDARQEHRDDQRDARPAAIGQRPDDEAREPAEQQVHRQGRRDGPAAPAERLGEHGQEHAEGGERGRDSVGDREQRGDDQPPTSGRTHPETSITTSR